MSKELHREGLETNALRLKKTTRIAARVHRALHTELGKRASTLRPIQNGRSSRRSLGPSVAAELRSRALATDLSQTPAPSVPGPHALDQLAAQLLQVPPVRAAVIADDLGLVISAQGSHGDELAALGALFNRACSEARRILPLGAIQRIALEDENHIHVSMRTVHAAVPSGDEDQLTLVTLAHGFEPDPSLVTRALAGASSSAADAVIT